MNWTLLTTSPDQLSAELLVQALREEGIEAQVNPGDTASFLGVSAYPCRVMVREDHWQVATGLLERWEEPQSDHTAEEQD